MNIRQMEFKALSKEYLYWTLEQNKYIRFVCCPTHSDHFSAAEQTLNKSEPSIGFIYLSVASVFLKWNCGSGRWSIEIVVNAIRVEAEEVAFAI